MTINPENHKIVKYLFKKNSHDDENLFKVMKQLFEESQTILISTPYIKNTGLFSTSRGSMTEKVSNLMKIPEEILLKKQIFVLTSNRDFSSFVKDACSPDAFDTKNWDNLLNSEFGGFKLLLPTEKNGYCFSHSKFYMFDRKQIIITSANFSKNGILDKRQMEIGVLIDISTTGEEFVETLNDCILMKNQEKVRQALKDARKKAERIEVSQEVKENKNKRHQLSEEKIKAIKDIIKENILKKDENEQNELGIMFEGQEKIKKNWQKFEIKNT